MFWNEGCAGGANALNFPIRLNIFGTEQVITRETSDKFVSSQVHVSDPEIAFRVRPIPSKKERLRGELYVFEETSPNGVRWDRAAWRDMSMKNRIRMHLYQAFQPLPFAKTD